MCPARVEVGCNGGGGWVRGAGGGSAYGPEIIYFNTKRILV